MGHPIVAILLALALLTMQTSSKDSVHSPHISLPGDVIIGGLFPIHKKGSSENSCGPFNEIPGYQYMEAMLYALEKINKRHDILPGIELGTIIYDTCRSPTITADRTRDLLKLTLSPYTSNGSALAGVVGPFTSGNTITVANFLRVFEIPQVSYGALTTELSEKKYSYFFRTVPPDNFFAEALAEFLKKLGWTYVSMIHSTGTYSETGKREVLKALSSRGICVPQRLRLPRFPSKEDFDKAIMDTVSVKEANVVVLITIQRDSRVLLKAKERQPLAKRLSFVGSVSWSNRDDITKALGHVADGTITFGHQEGHNMEYEEHFRSLNVSNYSASYKGWFEEYWQILFNCSLGNITHTPSETYRRRCTGNESLTSKQMEIAPVRVVINAVNAMAYALHDMHQNLCPNTSRFCQAMKPFPRTLLRKFLKNITFPDSSFDWPIRFDQNNEVEGNYTILNFRGSKPGVYSYFPVGNWTSELRDDGQITRQLKIDFSNIRWANGGTEPPSSVCSLECGESSIKVPRPSSDRKCCWDCATCGRYDVIANNTCQTCAEGYVPDRNLSTCLKLSLRYINMGAPLSAFFLFLACLGILANLSVIVVFLVNRKHPLIAAFNPEMCYFILFGIFLIFTIPFTFLAKPTMILCYAQCFVMTMSFTTSHAALLVKVRRIYWVFKREVRTPGSWEPNFISSKAQRFITIGITLVQSFFYIVISRQNKPTAIEKFYPDTEELLLECTTKPTAFVAYLACDVALALACTSYAFLARNIPRNFREPLYISITMYVTNVAWVVFLACILNIENSFSRAYLTSGSSVVIGWVTLVGLFAPKVYQLYTKRVYDEGALMRWRKSGVEQEKGEQTVREMDLCNTPRPRDQRLDVIKESNEDDASSRGSNNE